MIFYLYPSSQTRQHWAPFYGFLCTWALSPTPSLFPLYTNLVWDGEERDSSGLTSFPAPPKKKRGWGKKLTAWDFFLIQPFNELDCQSFLSLFLPKLFSSCCNNCPAHPFLFKFSTWFHPSDKYAPQQCSFLFSLLMGLGTLGSFWQKRSQQTSTEGNYAASNGGLLPYFGHH